MGVDSKFANLEKVEKARLDAMKRQNKRQHPDDRTRKPHTKSNSDDGQMNYGRARFMIGGGRRGGGRGGGRGGPGRGGRGGRGGGRGRGGGPGRAGVVHIPGDNLPDHSAAFEHAKKRAFDNGQIDNATYTVNPESMERKPREHTGRGGHNNKNYRAGTASDDHAFARFKKSTRRF